MSYFIVIHGPLGCGKSTTAKLLSDKLSAERIQLDDVLEQHGLDQVASGAYIPAENFIKAIDLVTKEVTKLIEQDKVVIFDGCFYHQEVMDHLLSTFPYKNYIFTLKAPVEVCIERDKNRPKTLGEDAARAVYRIVCKFDFGKVIDTENKSEEEVVKEMESHLPK